MEHKKKLSILEYKCNIGVPSQEKMLLICEFSAKSIEAVWLCDAVITSAIIFIIFFKYGAGLNISTIYFVYDIRLWMNWEIKFCVAQMCF